ncbi:MAG: hypothetical protein KC535_02930, partial [Nanoarchaeota archaeon]|nr:hypothetical protein [Nanoarchaeota archaeon]
TYRVIHPVTLLEKEQHVFVKGELVRYAMAKGRGYEHYLPPVVTTYLEEKGLIRRFQQEFGLQTLMRPPELYETVESEKKKVRAG